MKNKEKVEQIFERKKDKNVFDKIMKMIRIALKYNDSFIIIYIFYINYKLSYEFLSTNTFK